MQHAASCHGMGRKAHAVPEQMCETSQGEKGMHSPSADMAGKGVPTVPADPEGLSAGSTHLTTSGARRNEGRQSPIPRAA